VEAEELASEKSVGAVVTDIVMPGREGLELIKNLRSRFPRTPIVAMSGGGRAKFFEVLDIAGDLGADAVLRKPFQPRQLSEALSSAISAHAGQREIPSAM
jgi:CheY-like chemotaxis protein